MFIQTEKFKEQKQLEMNEIERLKKQFDVQFIVSIRTQKKLERQY
jgi:hypothetical protein